MAEPITTSGEQRMKRMIKPQPTLAPPPKRRVRPAYSLKAEMDNVMIDLETLGRRAGCVVLSIGAVGFDGKTLGAEFYTVLNVRNQLDHGLHQDDDTLA